MIVENPVRALAVDWSGAKTGFKRKIWLAKVVAGRLVALEDGRSREELRDILIQEAEEDPNLVVGFDFAFSFPAWFVREKGCADAPEFWGHVRQHGEQWVEERHPPFFTKGGWRGEKRDAYRSTDWSFKESGLLRTPETVFKLVGPTQVGKGAIRGMPILEDLRAAGFSIWPFDPPRYPLVLEIYPRLFYGQVTKSSPEAREGYLEKYPDLVEPLRRRAIASDDAFDAAVSALEIYPRLDEISELSVVEEEILQLEGRIWI